MRGWRLSLQLGGSFQCAIDRTVGKQGSALRPLPGHADYPDAFVIDVTTPST